MDKIASTINSENSTTVDLAVSNAINVAADGHSSGVIKPAAEDNRQSANQQENTEVKDKSSSDDNDTSLESICDITMDILQSINHMEENVCKKIDLLAGKLEENEQKMEEHEKKMKKYHDDINKKIKKVNHLLFSYIETIEKGLDFNFEEGQRGIV